MFPEIRKKKKIIKSTLQATDTAQDSRNSVKPAGEHRAEQNPTNTSGCTEASRHQGKRTGHATLREGVPTR